MAMAEPAPIPPLTDDELLYRRLPAHPQYYDSQRRLVKEVAFRPTAADSNGLSVSRQCVGPEGAAAEGRLGKQFYVAAVRAGDVTGLGLTIVADRPDHALITDLTHERRQSADRAIRDPLLKASADLTKIVREVVGPFPGSASPLADSSTD
jgi:hypothetical protein